MRTFITLLLLVLATAMVAQTGSFTLTDGTPVTLNYDRITRIVDNTTYCTVQYDITYRRYDVSDDFDDIAAAAGRAMLQFTDSNSGKSTMVPTSAVSQVFRNPLDSTAIIFTKFPNSGAGFSYSADESYSAISQLLVAWPLITSTIADTTDASGNLVVDHTLASATFDIVITPADSVFWHPAVWNKTDTTFTIRVFDDDGAAVTETAVEFDYFIRRRQ